MASSLRIIVSQRLGPLILTLRPHYHPSLPRGRRANHVATQHLISSLAKLNTSSLCDADKSLTGSDSLYGDRGAGLCLMEGLPPRNNCDSSRVTIMVGTARTVQCTDLNDSLAVLQGLAEAQAGEVLVVNTLGSTRAVAGELFTAEAARKGVRGILVDGAMRDTAYLNEFPSVRCYSKSISPYSGTIQSVGKTQVEVTCGGVRVSPGDIIVGDNDGILVGPRESFAHILETAQEIQKMEEAVKKRMKLEDESLHSVTNYEEHVKARADGKESSLSFALNT